MDKEAFRRASNAVWDAMASGWDERHTYFEETARPVTEVMLERLAPKAGETILDLAAGTGVVGFAAASHVGSEGRVIVSDFAEAMVEVARRHADELGLANVQCRTLDAEQLDLPDDLADGAVCRWGYMLMADPGAAFGETRRVLKPGGRLACAVFAGPDENPWASLPMAVLQERRAVPAPQPGAPGILALADRDRLRSLLTDAGFTDVHLEDVAFAWPFTGLDDYWKFLTHAAGAIATILAELDDDGREQVRAEIGARLRRYETDGGIRLPAVSVVASAS
jgi:ubiquinone/menaquinone biosynthesis C-methylase UbiE